VIEQLSCVETELDSSSENEVHAISNLYLSSNILLLEGVLLEIVYGSEVIKVIFHKFRNLDLTVIDGVTKFTFLCRHGILT
jgi:hypothetical protein